MKRLMRLLRKPILIGIGVGYKQLNKRLIFKISAQRAHSVVITSLRYLEKYAIVFRLMQFLHGLTFTDNPMEVGGVKLSHPLILAAGFVKGDGFNTEKEALSAIYEDKRNIIPGWKLIPALVGPVEFGSFTRNPRMGNEGTVIWRDAESQSTQNRVGLKNPGAMAAAKFLAQNISNLPKEYGINIAVSPGVSDINQQEKEVVEALNFFLDEGIQPTWFTLNISCPNTEDDPKGRQLSTETRQLCNAFIQQLQSRGLSIPLWVKISPDLAYEQYQVLIRIFHKVGVKAVIATNTLPQPSPDDSNVMAGVGGGRLFEEAVIAAAYLRLEKIKHNYDVDVVGCGGVVNGLTYRDYSTLGIDVVQYWSALVYRGPFAAALIESELPKHEYQFKTISSESLTQH